MQHGISSKYWATGVVIRRPYKMEKMNEATISWVSDGANDCTITSSQKQRRRWTAGLLLSAVLGAVAGLGGLGIVLLTIIGVAGSSTSLSTLSTLMIGTSFMLLGFAAHCIDKVDAADAIPDEENDDFRQ